MLPFDHDRQLSSVLVTHPSEGTLIVTKGAPEAILERCSLVPISARSVLETLFSEGARVVAVAVRPAKAGELLTGKGRVPVDVGGILDIRRSSEGRRRSVDCCVAVARDRSEDHHG